MIDKVYIKVRGLEPHEEKLIGKLLGIFYKHDFRRAILGNDIPQEQTLYKKQHGFYETVRPTIIEMDYGPEHQNRKVRESQEPIDNFDIDNLLGLYEPDKHEIKLFTKSIAEVANQVNIKEHHLKDVVLLHEFGHWITHRLPYKDVTIWENYHLKGCEDVHEGWAQLLAWWIAEKDTFLKLAFEKLNEKQSPPYHIYEWYKNKEKKDICQSLAEIRKSQTCDESTWRGILVKINPEYRGEDLERNLFQ